MDEARAVRDEDAFDVPSVHAWLRARVGGLPDAAPEVFQFPGGASNLTFLLRYPEQELVLRRPPRGVRKGSAHDMHREYDVQRRLRPAFPQVPAVLAYSDEAGPLGCPFYVMERVTGTILRSDLPDGTSLSRAEAAALGLGVFDLLADLHGVDVEAAGLADLGKGPGYARRQVEGWSARYRRARTDDVPEAEDVMSWLAARIPQDSGACLIHNDWRFDNMVLDERDLSTVKAVLDWEMATIGDPLLDLAGAVAYWVQADDDATFQAMRKQPSHLPGMPTRAEIVAHYLARTGREVDDWSFYEVFGVFRLAVILVQIWSRYRAGFTTNPAFATFGLATGYLVERSRALMGS